MEDGDFSFLHSDALKDQENNKGLFTVGHRASQETENICFFSNCRVSVWSSGVKRECTVTHTHTL